MNFEKDGQSMRFPRSLSVLSLSKFIKRFVDFDRENFQTPRV